MQNIPKEPTVLTIKNDAYTFEPRNYFMAEEGYSMIFMDADQQEYRLLAHYSKSVSFMDIVKQGLDIHTGTASMIFKVLYDLVTKDQRKKGKTCNFALVYGQGNAKFAIALGHSIDDARISLGTRALYKILKPWEVPPYRNNADYIRDHIVPKIEDPLAKDGLLYYLTDDVQNAIKDAIATKKIYFDQFPEIKVFIKDCGDAGKRRGYVKTWTGRRRHFKNPLEESYKGPNAVIQGGCGDIMKVKLAELHTLLADYKSYQFLTVHDEIGIMVHDSERHLIPVINAVLSDLPFLVPISWGIEIGQRWGKKEEYIA